MKNLFFILLTLFCISCKYNDTNVNDAIVQPPDSLKYNYLENIEKIDQTSSSYLYEQYDTEYKIGSKKFYVDVRYYDVTELAVKSGDTISRPTFACSLFISDTTGKVVFKDSLLRDSWGYKGKINSIDYYIMSMPILKRDKSTIVAQFNIYEELSLYSIDASLSIDMRTFESELFYEEKLME